MKSTLLLLALLGLSFQVAFGKHGCCGSGCGGKPESYCDRQEEDEDFDFLGELTEALIPGFAICNTEKGDGGITLDELHADICQDFIASVGDSEAAEYDFEYFDSNADGVVTMKEFLDLADSLLN